MPTVTVGQENNADIEIYYEDHGAGQPVVLIHGYPLSGRAWDKQVPALLEAGHRVITYDRRGFGRSSQPVVGYDYDTFAADLHALLEHLDLREAVLVGHSMGTGEVTRYLGSYGSARVAKGVLVSPIPPYLLATPDNPDGVPQSLFDGFVAAAQADTPAWMKGFLDTFYNMDTLRGTLVSDQAWQASWNIAVAASATAAVACIGTWTTDFRADLPKIDVPMLVLHGDADQVLPLDKTRKRLPGLIKDMQLTVVEGGPHAIPWTTPARSTPRCSTSCAADSRPHHHPDKGHRRSHHVEPLQHRLPQVSRRRPAPGHHRRVLVQVIQGPGQDHADHDLDPTAPAPAPIQARGPESTPARSTGSTSTPTATRTPTSHSPSPSPSTSGRQTGTAWTPPAPGPPARAGRRGARRVDPGQLRRHGPAGPGGPDPAARRAAQRAVLRRPRGHPARLRLDRARQPRRQHVTSIVLEVPADMIFAGPVIGVWASISRRRGDGTLEQMDRGANPTLNPFINPDGEKDLYNSRQPADDVANYLEPWSKTLEKAATRPRRPRPPPCRCCPTSCATTAPSPPFYPNGRRPIEDIYSYRFAWLSYGKIPPQGLNPHADLLTDFPYLGPPNP